MNSNVVTRPIRVTFFKNEFARTCSVRDLSLLQLRELIAATAASKKENLPWLKLAIFGSERSDEGSLRHNGNVLKISGVELDYDAGKGSFDEALRIFKQVRLLSLLYTSPSHTDAKLRFRVLAPSSRRLPPERRELLVARINGLFGGAFAPESFTLSQAYYFGSVNNRAHRAVVVDGDYMDQRSDLDAGAIGRRQTSSRRVANRRHQQTTNHEPIDRDLIVAALAAIPTTADWVDYWVWLWIGAGLFHEFGDDGFELFDRWSASSRHYNAAGCARKWRECRKFTEFTGRTILFYADRASPGWRAVFAAKQWSEMYSFFRAGK